MEELTPKQIVAELNKHIIGQDSAKRAVAIALRNRWRRAQVDEELRNEITPKNILIRAKKTSRTSDPTLVREYCTMRDFWHIKPSLERLLARELAPFLS